MSLEARALALRERIERACTAADRDPREVELLPVSKRQPVALVAEALGLGYRRFGENYVQEGAAKATVLPQASFLLIGPLQRNKARVAIQAFQELQSVDRLDLARRLSTLAEELDLVRPVWIQVDLWGEATKEGGCPEADLPGLIDHLAAMPRLPLQGFMALPPQGDPGAFPRLAALRSDWEQRLGRRLRLSAGMSGDLEAAIAAGSDQVRIGTAFFGARDPIS